ncbi:MAG: 50S ribosomal protein L21 [Candidatus Taylorbacteria bacterium RIFCSPHIGHO2_02_49_25]|uniref:Large ribosomal subunit protein bL21 n=1 Tax=Candidatus Taylorbacteria bacterium RIFCSPHIGHO2_02_49_25 TaxID=1802305 RepID=A0A1G2MFU0_9BACT|nr:MAG: 50S ribosomal protein L21 [Parcubacteria group bacterium GW2011_GWF2_50_9]OHA20798.1 MAG: 50S ribosomal protein L21 [Candidatus Taylorbacteria bacterium RIFCSPHIGHO2_01_FULL_49_60]OHA21872.1 MAG: 50S ribosomal protein L21 [Candidatus Taylorbacteria bacterium RIFCSPHIGHO2_02_49_25]OHA36680.1 MAG: 50S ribosomal protein L21 [Candidatus Taylorbacteria bacterium RIFCSPLOWO2_01_FULL_50_130]OHA37550.1 MAG: 50S ribosomal protein L21 [Candidatus Taylorbacteria bacterium RIFCSPLOWO2_02_50_13]OHA
MVNESKISSGVAFAVIETGGKQYAVKEGDAIKIEKLSDDFKSGDVVTFERVLLRDDGERTTLGSPHIAGAKVQAEITDIGRGRKIEVVKYKAKSRYFKLRGHRQPYMKVKIAKV